MFPHIFPRAITQKRLIGRWILLSISFPVEQIGDRRVPRTIRKSNLIVAMTAERAFRNHRQIIRVRWMIEILEFTERGSPRRHFCQKRVSHCRRVVLIFKDNYQYPVKMFARSQNRRLRRVVGLLRTAWLNFACLLAAGG